MKTLKQIVSSVPLSFLLIALGSVSVGISDNGYVAQVTAALTLWPVAPTLVADLSCDSPTFIGAYKPIGLNGVAQYA